MNSKKNKNGWEGDLEGLISEESLKSLRKLIDERKRKRSTIVSWLIPSLIIFFFVVILLIWLCTTWQNSVKADVANGIVAVILVLSTLLVAKLPTVSKDEVKGIISEEIPLPVFSKMKAEVGVKGENLEKHLAILVAAVLLLIIFLKSFVPDSGSQNNKEVNNVTREVPTHGRSLSP